MRLVVSDCGSLQGIHSFIGEGISVSGPTGRRRG